MNTSLSKETSPRPLWVNHFAVTPSDGGGTRHYELARELTRRNWRVTIAASDFHLHTRGYTRRPSAAVRAPIAEHIEGVDFLWLWAASYERNDWRRARNWLSFQRSLAHWHSNGSRPDVIIGSSPQLFAALGGYRMARRLRVPFLFEVRDLWPESLLAAGGSKGPAYHTLGAIARHLYKHADRVIVLTRGVAGHLEHRHVPRGKLIYIPNGADTDAFFPHARSRGPFTLIYAGAHGPANGLDTVLDAAELLNDQPIRLLLVGDGPSKSELRAKAERRELANVEFLDPVPKSAMPALLARAALIELVRLLGLAGDVCITGTLGRTDYLDRMARARAVISCNRLAGTGSAFASRDDADLAGNLADTLAGSLPPQLPTPLRRWSSEHRASEHVDAYERDA